MSAPAPSDRACIRCAAWNPYGSVNYVRTDAGGALVERYEVPAGQCRARPPTFDPASTQQTSGTWPTVEAEDWCAEFIRKN